jgi:hypothetical protein
MDASDSFQGALDNLVGVLPNLLGCLLLLYGLRRFTPGSSISERASVA